MGRLLLRASILCRTIRTTPVTVDPFKSSSHPPQKLGAAATYRHLRSLNPILCMARPLRPRFTGGNPFDEADASHNWDVEVNPDNVLF